MFVKNSTHVFDETKLLLTLFSFVIRVSLTKLTFGFGTIVYNTLPGIMSLNLSSNQSFDYFFSFTKVQFRSMSIIFAGFTFFLLGNHSQVFPVSAEFISSSVIAASTHNKAAAMWLQVEPMSVMQVQRTLKIFPHFCIM